MEYSVFQNQLYVPYLSGLIIELQQAAPPCCYRHPDVPLLILLLYGQAEETAGVKIIIRLALPESEHLRDFRRGKGSVIEMLHQRNHLLKAVRLDKHYGRFRFYRRTLPGLPEILHGNISILQTVKSLFHQTYRIIA